MAAADCSIGSARLRFTRRQTIGIQPRTCLLLQEDMPWIVQVGYVVLVDYWTRSIIGPVGLAGWAMGIAQGGKKLREHRLLGKKILR